MEELRKILLSLYGVGEKECDRLYELLKPEITENVTERQVRATLKKKKIFETLKADTQADIKYNPLKKIPRKLIDIVARAFAKTKWKLDVAGSYRRGKAFCRDIDVVIDQKHVPKGFESIAAACPSLSFIAPFAEGSHNIRTLICIKSFYLKIDFFIIPTEEYAACLLYCTGSQQLNIRMRIKAQKLGLKLDQHGLWKGDHKLPLKKESDFFEALGMNYLEPHEREL